MIYTKKRSRKLCDNCFKQTCGAGKYCLTYKHNVIEIKYWASHLENILLYDGLVEYRYGTQTHI